MSRHVIIAVGGTGQEVLRYFNQFYLLKAVENTEPHYYRGIVVDTDRLNANLELTRDFFLALRVGTDPWQGAAGHPVPMIDYVPVPNRAEDEVSKALTALPLRELSSYPRHAAKAFFSTDALAQTVKQGLFARPALSTVISGDWTNDQRLALDQDSQVVVVGSVIGGTGGGLLAPLLATLKRQRDNLQKVTIRVVLFSEYFNPNKALIGGAPERFWSNQALGLRSIEEVSDAIDLFAVVGLLPEERMDERDQSAEQSGWNLPWPHSDRHPFWRGAEMVNHFLLDPVSDRRVVFRDREVGAEGIPAGHKVKLDTAKRELRQRAGRAEALVMREAVKRMQADPFARWVWGDTLVRTVADFWKMTTPAGGSFEIDRNFCAKSQQWLHNWWERRPACISGLFPTETPERASLPSIRTRKVDWPRLDAARSDRKLFGGAEEAARRAAATLIWWALRG